MVKAPIMGSFFYGFLSHINLKFNASLILKNFNFLSKNQFYIMKTPQEAIFIEGTNQFTFLEFKLHESATPTAIKNALKQIVSKGINTVTGFGKNTWQMLNPSWEPEGFTNFKTLNGVEDYNMPATQNDIYFWLHSNEMSLNFDAALSIKNAFLGLADLVIDQNGFTYHDSRDLIGFVDGTANPKDEKKIAAAIIAPSQIGEGGSIVFTQRWVHDLGKFNAHPVKEQEGIVGRTKPDSIELEGDEMPHNSHVSRTDVKIDGEAMKIYRRSAPYGNANENGLFFIAFSCHTKRVQIQLERMVGATPDGVYDRLMEFSTPVTGSYWFAPSKEDLKNILK